MTPNALDCRAALALHKMALSMMQRQCQMQAFETFRHSMSVLKTAMASDDGKGPHQRQDVENKLKQAQHFMTQPQSNMSFQNVSLEVLDSSSLLSFDDEKGTSEKSQFQLVQVEEEDLDYFDDESHFPLSIIMYNTAISSICLAKHMKKDDKVIRLYEGAIKLLTLSGHFLSMVFEHSEDNLLLYRVAVVSNIVLSALAQILTARGRDKDAIACLSTANNFSAIVKELQETERSLHVYGTERCAASAA